MTSLQQKDTTFTKIFVGGLPYHTTDDTLQRFFEPYGEIDEAVVITDRQTGKSRGYGFVTMSDRASAERACKDPNPIIDGRKANVNLAYLGAKPRIPVGELIAAFPYGLKTGMPSYFGGTELLGLPQIVYQSGSAAAYLPTSPTSFTIAAPQAPTPHHHLLPATLLPATAGGAGHFLDYAALAAAYSSATCPLTSTLSLGIDSMSTMHAAAFPYNGGGGSGGGYFGGTPSAPTAYATLPYATGPMPTQTVLGQFATQQFHTQHVHHTTKLQ